MKSSAVAVVIVNYNSGVLLAKSLLQLSLQTYTPDKILIIDNNSTDDSLDNLPVLENLEIVKLTSNEGFARANNIAAKMLPDVDFLTFLNPDAFPEPCWLNHLLEAAEKWPEYAFFGSKMIDANDKNRLDGTGDEYHFCGMVWRRNHGKMIIPARDNLPNKIFSPCAGAALYRKDKFDELGGFDEDYFCYMEDVDLGFRMQLAGYKGFYIPRAVVYHIGSAITGRNSDFSVYYGHRNLVWTYLKNMPLPLLILTMPAHLLLNLVTVIHFIFKGQGNIILKAKKDALASLPEVLTKRAEIQSHRKVSNGYIWEIFNKKIISLFGVKKRYAEGYFHNNGSLSALVINGFKVAVKDTMLAPVIYAAYAKWNKYKNYLFDTIQSSQNKASINAMVTRRKQVLMSDNHVKWLKRLQSSDGFPLLDVSIVTYNNSEWIAKFTRSLLDQDYPLAKINLCFVDNTSVDNTLEKLHLFRQQYAHMFASITVFSHENKGFGAGHDFAIRQGQSEFILVSNIDLQYSHNAISSVVAMAMNDDNEVASWELRQKPFEHPKYYDPLTLETAWSSHACVLLKRQSYLEVGGYEPAIFMYGEDVELSYRLRQAGYRLRYLPEAVIWHYSYNQAGEVKPLQFSGSMLANAYIRLRYGNFYDRLIILPLQLAKLIRGGGFPGSRKMVINNFKRLLRNADKFEPCKKADKNIYFPFRGFDYEMKRSGAFYQCRELPTDNLPRVSIITRTYQGRKNWLQECIVSVLNQTYPNIQHIIVEDGGATMQPLISQIGHSYDSCSQISYKALPKIGRSAAGNRGLELAQGEWLMFLDDDDLIMPDHVEVLVTELINNPELDAAYSLAWDVQTNVHNNNGKMTYSEVSHETPGRYYQEYSLDVLLHQNYLPIQAIMFKKSLFQKYGGFDEHVEYLEDWLLWIKYAVEHKFKWVNKTTSLFRTPYLIEEQVQRKLKLDSVYNVVISKQHEILQQHQH